MTPEKLNDLRRKVLNNEPYSEAEYTEACKEMNQARITQIEAPKPAGKKSTAKPVANLDDLLG